MSRLPHFRVSGPCTEKQPVKPCLIIDLKGLYQVSCNLFLCIQMKCQDKDIKISSPTTFPSENPSICWKNQLALDREWSLGWFYKIERHSKRTNAPKSPSFPLPHHPTLGPRKNYCNNYQERKIWWLPEQVSLFSSFPRWTAKSSRVFECVGFEMIYRLDFLLLVSIISQLGSEKNWRLIFEEQIGKSALRELYREREAASPGTKVNYVE